MPSDLASAPAPFRFDNSFVRTLDGLCVAWPPAQVPSPQLLFFNDALAVELGLDASALDSAAGASIFAGNTLPAGAAPVAQAYAGHQFGGFSPQLGDGRAVLLGEIVDPRGRRFDIALKGSGRTPFSRGGDGKAAVGPMLRELIIGEAMHALGIPTTRALAVAGTGEVVLREHKLRGAVLTRVAASHLRVGTFQYVAARGDNELLRALADYTIDRHDPALAADPDRYLQLLAAVANRQAALIAQWMNVGFIHGVMNTDNMTLSGETIDYGPCAFLEAYDPATVFSSIDHQGRYAYGNQPQIGLWNLTRLAECLLPLIDPDLDRAVQRATDLLNGWPEQYRSALLRGQRARLGLRQPEHPDADRDEADTALAADWLSLLHTHRIDYTLAWRSLADAATGNLAALNSLFADTDAPGAWLARWRNRCATDVPEAGGDAAHARAQAMRRASPRVIPRNHQVEAALRAASDDGDIAPLRRLIDAVRRPWDDDPALQPWTVPAPPEVTAAYQTFCGT